MKKGRWKAVAEKLEEKLQFLKLEDDADLEDEIQIEEESLSSAGA